MRRALSLSCVAIVALTLAGPSRGAALEMDADPRGCDVVDVDYTLAANLVLSDTPLGQGDGTYAIGPGTTLLRFDRRSGRVQMLAYRMTERFTIRTTALFWTTTVLTHTRTQATVDRCAVVAEGALDGRTLRWTSPVRGYATDGTLTCEGSLCGKLGAPPPGRSELHIPPHPVAFSPFELAADRSTFTMASTFVSRTDAPKQTAHLALAGRATSRTCARACP